MREPKGGKAKMRKKFSFIPFRFACFFLFFFRLPFILFPSISIFYTHVPQHFQYSQYGILYSGEKLEKILIFSSTKLANTNTINSVCFFLALSFVFLTSVFFFFFFFFDCNLEFLLFPFFFRFSICLGGN